MRFRLQLQGVGFDDRIKLVADFVGEPGGSHFVALAEIERGDELHAVGWVVCLLL